MNQIWKLVLFFGGCIASAIGQEATAEAESERPNFSMFGFTVQADEIDLNLGEAKGNVVVTGEIKEGTIRVEAGKLKVSLAEQSVVISDWPAIYDSNGSGFGIDCEERADHDYPNQRQIQSGWACSVYSEFGSVEEQEPEAAGIDDAGISPRSNASRSRRGTWEN